MTKVRAMVTEKKGLLKAHLNTVHQLISYMKSGEIIKTIQCEHELCECDINKNQTICCIMCSEYCNMNIELNIRNWSCEHAASGENLIVSASNVICSFQN